MMRAALKWVRRHWLIVAGAGAAVVIAAVAVFLVTSGPPRGYSAGTEKDTGLLGESFRQVDSDGAPWRWGAVVEVAEILPPPDGQTGRCYVAAGWVETTRAGFAEHTDDERRLEVAYYTDNEGALIPSGDASVCDADAFIAEAQENGYHSLADITLADTTFPQFYTVTYLSEDVLPDYLVLTSDATSRLGDGPSDASVYWFTEETDYYFEGVFRVIGDDYFNGRAGR